MIELLQNFPDEQADHYLHLWDDYAQGTSQEARLVKQLDRVEMLSQALAYERAGSRVMGEFWENIEDSWSQEFPIISAFVHQILVEHKRLNGSPDEEHNGERTAYTMEQRT